MGTKRLVLGGRMQSASDSKDGKGFSLWRRKLWEKKKRETPATMSMAHFLYGLA